jgi:hypothetical protein
MRTHRDKESVAAAVHASLETRTRANEPRKYVGASAIGHVCDRYLYYVKDRVAGEVVDARGARIFEFGDAVEELVVRWLRDCDLVVHTHAKTGDQFFVMARDKTLGGHCDGVVYWPQKDGYYLLEVKSHKDARFKELKNGGLRETKFEHYAQMQVYLAPIMRLGHVVAKALGRARPLKILGGLYIAVNKDTCELHIEEVYHDPETFTALHERASRVNAAQQPFPRVASSVTRYPCSWCTFKVHCYTDE